MFRASFRRALALAGVPAVLAAAAVSTPATAAFPGCDPEASTRLATGVVADTVPYYVWVQRVSDVETRVCVGRYPADISVVVYAGLTVVPPSVTPAGESEWCETDLLVQQDTVPVGVAVTAGLDPRLCLRVADQEVTLRFVLPLVGVAVWRDASPALGSVVCAPEYLAWRQAGGGSGSPEYAAYHSCLTRPERLV